MVKNVAALEASIDIDASPARVWSIVSDQRRMNDWSPETHWQKFFRTSQDGNVGRGTRSLNVNKRKGFFWPTLSTITEFEPEKRLAFFVHGPAALWSYDLTPQGDGTRVTETRTLKNSRRSIASVITAAMALGGVESHDVEVLAGMHTTLERMKVEVEA